MFDVGQDHHDVFSRGSRLVTVPIQLPIPEEEPCGHLVVVPRDGVAVVDQRSVATLQHINLADDPIQTHQLSNVWLALRTTRMMSGEVVSVPPPRNLMLYFM